MNRTNKDENFDSCDMTDDIDPENEVESMVDGIYAMARGDFCTLADLIEEGGDNEY